AELVFSRHQFDTAFWIGRDGRLQRAPCYDYKEKDRSFKEIARLPGDVPCLGFASERKGDGIALVVLSTTNLGRRAGQAADEQAHSTPRASQHRGRGSAPPSFSCARGGVSRDGYSPGAGRAASLSAEKGAAVVSRLNAGAARRYDELIRWHKVLTNPLEI